MAAPVSADAIGKARAWVFTWNNYTHTVLFPDGLPAGIKYCIYSAEKGADGTPHLQGYIVFNGPRWLGGIRKIVCKTVEGVIFKPFETAHLAIAKGDAKSNKAYCSKMDETHVAGPWELGELPKQGARMDLEEAVAKLMETHGDFTQIDQVTFARNAHGLSSIVSKMSGIRRPNLKIICIVGKTGIGKSYAIHDLYPDLALCSWGNSGAWFHNYRGQRVIAFEEFRGQIKLQTFLQYTDPYPVHLEQKGGAIPCNATLIFVTSNSEPKEWYQNDPMHPRDEELAALYRRMDYVPTGCEAQFGRTNGVRYIKADTREELHRKLRLALAIEDLEPKPVDMSVIGGKGPADAAPAAAPAAAAAVPMDEDDAAPELAEPLPKRRTLMIPDAIDAMRNASPPPQLLHRHPPSFYAPRP